MSVRRACHLAVLGAAFGAATAAAAVTLDMPTAAAAAADRREAMGSHLLATGPHAGGVLPTRRVEGAVTQTAWRIEAKGVDTLALLAPLRAQLQREGFRIEFECEAAACGGFDFRYGLDILPEPEMHVDLGDYRYLCASRGAEAVSLIVSRSLGAGFVQVTHVGPPEAAAVLTASTKARPEAEAPPATPAPQPAGLVDKLEAGVSVPLDDLAFATGSAQLEARAYATLAALADWLKADPARSVAVVGHTDASGPLETNILLSRKRAESVRARLIEAHGVAPARIKAEGVGFLAPRASNLTEEGRHKNRRVEVMATSTP
jgi:OOP family OmpA-OmpF porin